MVCQDCSVKGYESVVGHAKWQLLQPKHTSINQTNSGAQFHSFTVLILKIAQVGYNSVLQYKGLKWLYCISSLWQKSMEYWWNNWQDKVDVFRETHATSSHCLP